MNRRPATRADAQEALQRFGAVGWQTISRLGQGLINETFAVEGEGRWVLQRVHPIFAPEIHHNIVAVTDRLASRGLVTPRLVLADDGRPWTDLGERGIWRVMTRVPGVSFDAPRSPAQIRAAARLLARFHGALEGLEHTFVAMRSGVHDTAAHLAHLERMLEVHADDPLHEEVARLGARIFERVGRLPDLGDLPARIVHGDPKLNNVLFAGTEGEAAEQAVCWIDLDTVGPMPLHLELGDAWRSWCNRGGEDEIEARFDLDVFEASLVGYAEGSTLELRSDEREALVYGLEWITLELCARFAADALARSYFGWDASRFPSAGEHNLVRARGQWSLHERAVALRSERAGLIDQVLRSGSSA
jgi:Ser/Thr protein kinase RdoA (MazF antagonist)